MNYFFTHLLTALFPFAILLGCLWTGFDKINLKRLNLLSILGFGLGILVNLNSPTGQQVQLILTIISLVLLFAFCICRLIPSQTLAYCGHFSLLLLAGISWAKDPNIVAITNTEVINTDFILNLSAVILGVIFCFFISAWLRILFRQTQSSQKLTALYSLTWMSVIILLFLPLVGELLLGLMKLQLIELTKLRLTFVAKVSNLISYFNYIHSFILLFIIGLFGINVYYPQKHIAQCEQQPIEKRKKIALMLSLKRTTLYGIFAIIIALTSQLYWDLVASKPPQLSEAIPVVLDEKEQITIPIEQVKDGKLHRFVWIASDGKAVRFFVINRSNKTLSLAVVFDACILCGDQGYVMEGDQVVCIGCGVRMFIPSIGKPGGCNPVPIENWQQTETEIILNRQHLEDGLNYFSTIVELDVIDPVDNSPLKNTKAEHRYNYEGKTYFFANEKNLTLFRDHPENYLTPKQGAK